MKSLFNLIVLTIIVIFAPDANSQIFSPSRLKNRVKERAENKAEQKVNEQVDKGVDKVFDSIFGAVEKSIKGSETKKEDTSSQTSPNSEPGEEEAMNMLKGILGGMGGSAEPAEVYTFDASFTMKMSMEEKGKKNDFSYKYLFSQKGNYMGAQMQAASDPQMAKQLESMEAIVFDFEKNSFFTFMKMNGQKSMIGMSIPSTTGEALESQYEKSTYTATGATKSILGNTCEGYKVVQDGEEYFIWISKNRVEFMDKYYELFNKMSSAPNSQAMAYDVNPEIARMVKEGRMMMGMEMVDTKGNKSTMEVIEIKPSDSFAFSTDGYSNMMDMSKIMEQAQQESKD